MIECRKCSTFKSIQEFSKNRTRKNGLSHWCKLCAAKERKKYYHLHKKEALLNLRENKNKYKAWANDLKNKPCKDCGKQYPYYVMQWHHRNPKEKLNSISNLTRRNVSKNKILQEIEKCDLLCANCHAIKSFRGS